MKSQTDPRKANASSLCGNLGRILGRRCHWSMGFRKWRRTGCYSKRGVIPKDDYYMCFQQYGATCHTARYTLNLLRVWFEVRDISQNWPPISCNLPSQDNVFVVLCEKQSVRKQSSNLWLIEARNYTNDSLNNSRNEFRSNRTFVTVRCPAKHCHKKISSQLWYFYFRYYQHSKFLIENFINFIEWQA